MLRIEHEAAGRTLNGNGANPSLPPLPTFPSSSSSDENHHSHDGLETLFSHPYGALPYGNIYTAPPPPFTPTQPRPMDYVRRQGLGPLLRHLNDEQLLSVLSFLDGTALARIVQVSRYLYVAGHHDELWRDLTLRAYGEDGFDFDDSWRDTYCRTHNAPRRNVPSHVPIVTSRIYSDTFFRSWLCRSFALDPSLSRCSIPQAYTVPTEEASKLSTHRFLSEYEIPNRPVHILNATVDWPAVKKWNVQYLVEKTEGVEFRATSGAAPLPASFTFRRYARYCGESFDDDDDGDDGDGDETTKKKKKKTKTRTRTEEAPLYLFDRNFRKNCPALVEDYEEALYKSCPYFDRNAEHGHDLFGILGEERRPDFCWIIAGPKRSGSAFHIDPNGTHAWNAPILGRKHWIFYPPGTPPPGIHPSPSGDDVILPISLGEWYLTYWNEHVQRRNSGRVEERPMECVVSPGDILFVPHGWWHCVLNLDEGMSVGLTQNYVSGVSNLGTVLRFLERRVGQISGCRDRVLVGDGEGGRGAVRPECLLGEFRERLREVRPDMLEEAQGLANGGWRCAAWNDDDDDDDDDDGRDDDGRGSTGDNARGCGVKEQEEKDDDDDEKENRKKQKLRGGMSVIDRAKLFNASLSKGDPNGAMTSSSPSPTSAAAGFTFSFM